MKLDYDSIKKSDSDSIKMTVLSDAGDEIITKTCFKLDIEAKDAKSILQKIESELMERMEQEFNKRNNDYPPKDYSFKVKLVQESEKWIISEVDLRGPNGSFRS